MKTDKYTQEEYNAAKEVVEEKMKFYSHLAVYLIVNTGLHILNYIMGAPYWAIWPALGWGMGVFFHGINTFGFFNNSEWKRKQIQKELEKNKKD